MTEARKQKDFERKEKTRRSLLDAAIKVFARQGYHKTLISDIVAEAQVGQGTFYRNFTDKRQIFSELKDEFIISLLTEFSEMNAHLPSDFESYRNASVLAIMNISLKLDENKDFVLCLFNEAPAIDKEFSNEVSAIYERFAQVAKQYLDHAIEQGFARQCNTLIVSEAIVGMGLRVIHLWLNGSIKELSIQNLVEEIVDFGFMGLKVEPTIQ